MYNDQKKATDRVGKKLEVKCQCKYCAVVEKECEFGHVCTSDCQNTKDCPCQSDHFCSMSEEHAIEDCEGVCGLHGGKEEKAQKVGEALSDLERGN